MAIPIRDRIASADPRFVYLRTDDGSWTLEDVVTGNTFHSGCGAVAECEVVYADNSLVTAGLAAGNRQRVLELGFGTGLAFLVTASIAKRFSAPLDYVAFEQRPLDIDLIEPVLVNAKGTKPVDEEVADLLFAAVKQVGGFAIDSTTVLQWSPATKLTVRGSDLRSWQFLDEERYNAVYFDPFDPASNSELWTLEMYGKMYSLLEPGGRLTSYCVKSEVRRALESVGFKVSKVSGPVGGKREVLVAERPARND